MNRKEIKARVETGEIHCRLMFQVVGNPKDYVEKLMDDYLISIDSEAEFTIIEKDKTKAQKEGNVYSVVSEVEMLVKTMQGLSLLCFNYMPSSIEISDPKSLNFKRKDLDAFYNDLLAKLHEVNMLAQEAAMQNKVVLGNMKAIIENAILLSVKHGNNITQTAEHLGMKKKDLDPFAAGLLKAGKLVQKGQKLERAKKKTSKASPKAKKK